MKNRGIEHIHSYCVDNCLVRVADPVFIGYCASKQADCAAKAVRKVDPHEPVGVICLKNDAFAVVEYSEISKEMAEQRENDLLAYRAANIANHYYTRAFLELAAEFAKNEMEFHVAKKKITHVNKNGELIIPKTPNGIKLEQFVFDVFPIAKRFCVLEVERSEEFSPLKNASGSDSSETSKRDILAQHKRWLEKAGAQVSGPVELSPLESYAGEGLEKYHGKKL